MVSREQLDDEAARVRKVRHLVDLATSLIMQGGMTRTEAEQLVAVVREQILQLFPDAEETYEVVYSRRFRRLVNEFSRSPRSPRAAVIPFSAKPA